MGHSAKTWNPNGAKTVVVNLTRFGDAVGYHGLGDLLRDGAAVEEGVVLVEHDVASYRKIRY